MRGTALGFTLVVLACTSSTAGDATSGETGSEAGGTTEGGAGPSSSTGGGSEAAASSSEGTAADGESTGCNARSFYPDADGDGWGDSTRQVQACEAPRGWVDVGDDCDDDEALRNPGQHELCGDGLDNDCDDKQDEWSPANTACNGCIMIGSSIAHYVCEGSEAWEEQAERCESFGAQAASVHGGEENDLVAGLVQDAAVGSAYLGYRFTPRRGWQWSDGSALDFEAWADGRPPADALGTECATTRDDGTWVAAACDAGAAEAIVCRDASP